MTREYIYQYVYESGVTYYGAIVFHSRAKVKEFISKQFPGIWKDDATYKVDCEDTDDKFVLKVIAL